MTTARHILPASILCIFCLLSVTAGAVDNDYHGAFHHPLRQALLSTKSGICNAIVIRTTTTRISFAMVMPKAFAPDGYCGCDYCKHIEETGQFAPVETLIFDRILSNNCRAGQGTVIDIGGNIGYFALVAASYGCRVTTFEPNDEPRSYMKASVAYNGFGDRVRVVAAAAGEQHSSAAMPKLHKHGWGFNKPVGLSATDNSLKEIAVVPLSSVVDGDVLLLKVDTEGFEDRVFRGAWDYLNNNEVLNIVMEVKGFNMPEKRALLRNISTVARLPYVYNYKEHYALRSAIVDKVNEEMWTPSFNEFFVDVSQILLQSQDSIELKYEDFWFSKAKVIAP